MYRCFDLIQHCFCRCAGNLTDQQLGAARQESQQHPAQDSKESEIQQQTPPDTAQPEPSAAARSHKVPAASKQAPAQSFTTAEAGSTAPASSSQTGYATLSAAPPSAFWGQAALDSHVSTDDSNAVFADVNRSSVVPELQEPDVISVREQTEAAAEHQSWLGEAAEEQAEVEADLEGTQEVERETLAAGQQLARDNSQALRGVRQAMQAESDSPGRQLQLEDESQDGTSLSRIQESEREALAAGQQLAEDNSQALREVRQAMQHESETHDTPLQQEEELQDVAAMGGAKEQEKEREGVAAAQQLARDNSLALREVRQAMSQDQPGRSWHNWLCQICYMCKQLCMSSASCLCDSLQSSHV